MSHLRRGSCGWEGAVLSAGRSPGGGNNEPLAEWGVWVGRWGGAVLSAGDDEPLGSSNLD